jgi:hypothetical protein
MRAFFMNEKLNDQGLGDFPNQEAPNLSVHIKEIQKKIEEHLNNSRTKQQSQLSVERRLTLIAGQVMIFTRLELLNREDKVNQLGANMTNLCERVELTAAELLSNRLIDNDMSDSNQRIDDFLTFICEEIHSFVIEIINTILEKQRNEQSAKRAG